MNPGDVIRLLFSDTGDIMQIQASIKRQNIRAHVSYVHHRR